jgi:tetratricopeptide (TPR) repeat protein
MKSLLVLAVGCAMAGISGSAQEKPAPSEGVLAQVQLLVEAREFEKASELLSDLVRREPGNETAHVKLGQVRLAQGLNEDALKSFETVLAVSPDSRAAREGEVRAAEAAALADRNTGIDGSALLCLIRARKFVPDDPRLLLDFGIQAESMQIYADADAALTKARDLAPDDPKLLYALAHVEFDEQKMQQAEVNLRAYLKIRPDDATAHYGLGRLLHMLIKDDEAKAELERSIALKPGQSGSYNVLGEIALGLNQPDEAKKNFERVLSLAPHHGGALTGLGILAYRAKDYAAAEEYLESAVTFAPDYVAAHHYYSLVLARLGHEAESKREADLATTLNAQDSKARHGNQLTVLE